MQRPRTADYRPSHNDDYDGDARLITLHMNTGARGGRVGGKLCTYILSIGLD